MFVMPRRHSWKKGRLAAEEIRPSVITAGAAESFKLKGKKKSLQREDNQENQLISTSGFNNQEDW